MKITPEEMKLTGNWVCVDGTMIADAVATRIAWLKDNYLVKIATDNSGWETLYRDPEDGRLWEHTYPQSEMHGGGPPQIEIIMPDEAARKYGVIK